MNKKGFTLIELLAVIVILAVIALIATPMVLDTIDDAKKGAASSSAYSYMSGVETAMASYMITSSGKSYPAGSYDITKIETDLNVSIKGSKPTKGNLCIGTDGTVIGASIMIDGYVVNYDGKEATTTDLKDVETVTCSQEGAGSGGEAPEVTQVELREASDAVKTANNYIGEVDNLGTASGYITVSINGSRSGMLSVGQIMYFPTELTVTAPISSSTLVFTYAPGYYEVITTPAVPEYMNVMAISAGGSQYSYIKSLGESYQVNAQ